MTNTTNQGTMGTKAMMSIEAAREIVAAAAVCAQSGYDVSRRLRSALRDTPVAADAESARVAGAKAGPQPFGRARTAPQSAVERVWCWLDREFGAEITRAMY